MKKAFWNGTEPITYQVVEYLVLPATVKTWWVNRVAFEVRQGILIKTQNGHEFLIDNKFGDGYGKIASGGDPQVGHKSVENYEIKTLQDVENFHTELINVRTSVRFDPEIGIDVMPHYNSC